MPEAEAFALPASFAQRRLWFLQQWDPASAAYNVSLALRCVGDLDADALTRALEGIVRRHEPLRTTFALHEGEPVQLAHPEMTLGLDRVDLTGVAAGRREAALQDALREDARRPFDLATGPVVRARLFALAPREHVLLLQFHHAAFDGWSGRVLLRELREGYEAARAGATLDLPPLPIQYGDFALWQREEWARGAYAKPLEEAAARLRGAPPLEIPTDRPRPAVRSSRGGRVDVPLTPEEWEATCALGRRHGATPFMTLLAAFHALLHRLSGQDDVTVGSPVAGRALPETEGLIGFFVNTLAVRADLSGSPTFEEALRRVREACLAAYATQDVPFEKLVDALQPGRDLSRTPLVQALFAVHEEAVGAFDAGGVTFTPIPTPSEETHFDLDVQVVHGAQGATLRAWYSSDLLDEATVLRWLGHYRTLLAAAVADPRAPLTDLPLLTPEERDTILLAWNDTRVDHPLDRTLHALVEAQAARTPDRVALVYEGESLTYRELDARAERLAARLRARGVGPDAPVAVLAERSFEMVVGLLGVLKAGGAYLPLDPEHPPDRLAYVLDDARPPVVLAQARLAPLLPQETPLLLLEKEADDAAPQPPAKDASRAGPDHVAYVIYTSGSTGKPKGVMVPHRGIVNRLLWMQDAYGLREDDVVLQKTPFGFDVSVWEFFWPLLAGARLVLARPGAHRDPHELSGLIHRERVTTLHFVPSMLRAFLDAADAAACGSLRRVICSGEALPRDLQDRFLASSAAELHNLYGPTEASVDVSAWACRREDDARSVPIGRPIANTQLYVLDARLRPVPVGVAGELHIGGVGLARGYLGKPELTADRFIPDPYSAQPGARLYRTGDLARFRSDGAIEFLGRLDHQVKVRGHRIELGEVEATLLEHPDVRDAVVVAHADAPGENRLVAYVVGKDVATGALRAFLKEKLPEPMVPSAFVLLDALPLNANGKVDRKALPPPGGARPDLARPFTAPRTPVEAALAAAWAQVLRLDRVGVHDDFFELGGDSIMTIQLVGRARERGIHLTPRAVFERPTIAQLATALPETPASPLPALRPFQLVSAEERERLPEGVEDAYPLTRLQLGMLFHGDYAASSSMYHNWDGFRLRLPLDEAALGDALGRVMARHPVLRTSFDLASFGEPLQLVHRDVAPPLAVEDLRDLPAPEREAALERWVEEEKRRRFDWRDAPLFRVTAHRLDDESFHLSVTNHHAILDGWSLMILIEELLRGYVALLRRAEPAEAPAPAPFAAYVALERDALASDEARAYWTSRLGDAEAVAWPPPARAGAVRRVVTVQREFTDASSRLVQAAARALGVPVSTVCLAAHARVLALHAGQSDIVTGVVSHGRPEEPGGDRTLGLFLNALPLRLRLGDGAWSDLVRSVHEAERSAWSHRRYPMAQVRKDLGRPALSDTLFTFTHWHALRDLHEEDGVRLLDWRSFAETDSPFAVFFTLDLATNRLKLILQADEARLDADALDRIARHYVATVEALARDPTQRHERHSPLDQEERRRILVDWNTVEPHAVDALHRLFAAQAARTPDDVAVTFESRHLTYRELDARANRLARRLRALGVGPDDLVALSVERSLDLVVGMLGILKAGGAYVPLDPSYPRERLAFMLQDAKPRVLVTRTREAAALPPHPQTLLLDAPEPGLDGGHAALPPLEDAVEPHHVAYVIYTSGSTGQPKGVMVTHANVARLFAATRRWFEFGAEDVWTLFHSFSFDFSVWEVWGALLHGGRLVVVPAWMTRSPDAFHTLLRDERVTVLNQTPSAFRQLIQADERAPPGRGLHLRLVVFGGEALDPATLRPWLARHGDAAPRLVNMYGITETTVHVTYRPVLARDVEEGGRSPIGRPIPDLQLYVLDAKGELAPVGAPGELHVGGAGLARGYLERPDLTAQRFVPHPFSSEPGARLYRTGDLARQLPDGSFEYLGRCDEQVKVRGFRVEPGEIEAALVRHPDVREAVVLARPFPSGEKRLVAYVVPAAGASPTVSDLKGFVGQRLPEHMVPAALVLLPALPLTRNGKVDRAALPEPGDERPNLRGEYVEPRTDAERALADVWSGVLRVARVGVEDDFFELGGDSILSLQVVARARLRGLHLTPEQVFRHPTVSRLAAVAAVDAAPAAAEDAHAPGPVVLTPIQRWFLDQELPKPHHFNQSVVLEGPPLVDPAHLGEAAARLVARHDALRLRLARDADGWRQEVVAPGDPPAFEHVDLSALDASAAAEAIGAHAARLQEGLDLARGPLLAVGLFTFGEARPSRVLLVAHHLAVDAVSWQILLEELEVTYAALAAGDAPRLPPRTASFRRWAEGLAAYAASPEVAAEAAHWADRAKGDLPPPLPRDHAGGRNLAGAAHSVVVQLAEHETRLLLQEVPKAYRTQVNDALLAALAQAAASWTGSASLLVDVEGHGREDVLPGLDVTRTVGWFTTMCPVLLRLERPDDAGDALRRVKEDLRAVPRRGIGYGLLRHLRPDDEAAARLRKLPAPDVSFNYLGRLDGASDAPRLFRVVHGEPRGPERAPEQPRSHALEVSGGVRGGRLSMAFTYAEDVHARETIERLATAFLERLRGIIAHCTAPGAGGRTPSDFPLAKLDQRKLDAILRNLEKTA